MARSEEILAFWFGPPQADDYDRMKEKWFRQDDAFDRAIETQFLDDHVEAAQGSLDPWQAAHRSSLALILLLDQFPRNLFRNTGRAFATDAAARAAADAALAAGFERERPCVERLFLYLPFEHSEALEDQRRCVALFETMPDHPDREQWIDYAVRHLRIIERFGRFPHRNDMLGREPTEEERRWLAESGERFGTGAEESSEG